MACFDDQNPQGIVLDFAKNTVVSNPISPQLSKRTA
jgi:hypothetical protein